MKEEYIYLNYYQAMTFLLKINEFKENNPYFNDKFANSFYEYVLYRTYEIATTNSPILLNILPNIFKYKISKSLYNYLCNLTSIDVFDKKTLATYKEIISDFENMSDDEFEIIQKSKKKMH